MKGGEQRARKWSAKFDPEVVRGRYTAVKDLSVEQQNARQAEHAQLMADVREILNAHGITPLLTVLYTSFANKVWGLTRKFAGSVLESEAHLMGQLWVNRGAEQAIVNDILGLFGISPLP